MIITTPACMAMNAAYLCSCTLLNSGFMNAPGELCRGGREREHGQGVHEERWRRVPLLRQDGRALLDRGVPGQAEVQAHAPAVVQGGEWRGGGGAGKGLSW